MKDKKELLELIGRFYVERNLYMIRPYLHSNIMFSTVIHPQYKGMKNNWEEKDIYGTKDFIRYYSEKFSNGNNAEKAIDYVVSKNSFKEYYFIILKTIDRGIIASVSFHKGKIKVIHLYPSDSIKNAFYYSGRAFINAQAEEMNKRLHRFASHLDMKNVLQCLNKGANINSRNENGETALTIISKSSKLDFVNFPICEYHIKNKNIKLKAEHIQKIDDIKKRLADAGYIMEIDFGVRYKETSAAVEKSHKLINEYIKKITNPLPNERIEMMKKLLERGAWINDMSLAVKKSARNALFYSVKNAELETAEFLLNNGASINEKYSGIKENITEIAKEKLYLAEGNLKKFETEKLVLIDGNDREMQEKEISDLKQIIILLEKYQTEK